MYVYLSVELLVIPLRPLIYYILWREMGNNTIGGQQVIDDDENVEYFIYTV